MFAFDDEIKFLFHVIYCSFLTYSLQVILIVINLLRTWKFYVKQKFLVLKYFENCLWNGFLGINILDFRPFLPKL